MIDVIGTINERIKLKLKTENDAPYHSSDLYFSSTKQATPSQFPTLCVSSIGAVQTGNDLERKTQNFIISTIELKAYTNTSVSDARRIMNYAGDVMISMGYEVIAGVEDVSDSKCKIAFARFRRTVGSGDIL